MTILRVLCALAWVVLPGCAATTVSVEQLTDLIASSRAAGDSDEHMVHRLSGVELSERLQIARLPAGLGPKTSDILRVLAAESAFLPPAAGDLPADSPPSQAEQDALLGKAATYASNYVQALPDLVCTKATSRYDDALRARHVVLRDRSSDELTYRHGQESDEPSVVNRLRNGVIPQGLTSYGEFGSILTSIFASASATALRWSHWEVWSQRRAAVFGYAIDSEHSLYTIIWCCRENIPQSVRTAYTGEITVDRNTGEILRVTRKASLPDTFPTRRADTAVEYQAVNIDGQSYFTPASSLTISEAPGAGSLARRIIHYLSVIRFSDYQKFVTTSSLKFDTQEAGASPSNQAVLSMPSREMFRRLRFSPDGKYVLAQGTGAVAILSVRPFEVLFRIAGEDLSDAGFTPAGELVFIGGGSHADSRELKFAGSPAKVERWSVAERRLVASSDVGSLACGTEGLSPDGKAIVCVDFEGTLRLIDVASGQTFVERKKFTTRIVFGMNEATGDPGSARLGFSPDGRYLTVGPRNSNGSPKAWDLHDRKELNLKGELKDLRWATYAFAGPNRLVIAHDRQGLVNSAWVSAVVNFPSGQLISKLNLPVGAINPCADPNFVMVRSRTAVAAVAYQTGRTIANDTAAMDVLGDRYIVQRSNGDLELH